MRFLSLGTGAIVGIIAGAVAFLILLYVIWYITTRNGFVTLRNDVEESYSVMDVQMKKRYDLIPNLVATCKGYAKHESETFTKVTQARNNAVAAATPEDRARAEKELGSSLRTLMNFVHEQYPQLKADSQFNGLSEQLKNIEEEIARSRRFYNAKVKAYNIKLEKFPSSIIANKMRLERKPFFELDDVSERVAPKVNFD